MRLDTFDSIVKDASDYIGRIDNIHLEVEAIYNVFRNAKNVSCDDNSSRILLVSTLTSFKEKLPPRYIIQYDPIFLDQDGLPFIKRSYFNTDEEYLDGVVLATRKRMFDDSDISSDNYILESFYNMDGFKSIDVSDKCHLYSKICNDLFKRSGLSDITSSIKEIKAGFSNGNRVDNYLCYHYYVEACLNEKKYIIDTTYSQFFLLFENVLESLGICHYDLPLPGVYMIQDEYRLKVARTLLERGWIEATDENIKAYFDGFALSFRNGKYYEQVGKCNYKTNYSSLDYESFALKRSSQLDIEKISCLGYQTSPLKDSSFDYTSDKVLFESEDKKLVKKCQLNKRIMA